MPLRAAVYFRAIRLKPAAHLNAVVVSTKDGKSVSLIKTLCADIIHRNIQHDTADAMFVQMRAKAGDQRRRAKFLPGIATGQKKSS